MGFRHFLELSFQIAKSGFKLRNEGSYLGVLWYLLNPLLLFVLLILVFSDRLGNEIPQYPVYLLMGIIMFNFFQQVTNESSQTLIKDYSLMIKSINLPRESIIAGITLKGVFSHIFEILLFLVFLFFLKGSLLALIFYPLIFLFNLQFEMKNTC